MFELDVRSRKPIYEQLTDKVKEMIMHGILRADEQLPSVRTLSSQAHSEPEYDPEGLQGAGAGRVHLFTAGQGQLRGPAAAGAE